MASAPTLRAQAFSVARSRQRGGTSGPAPGANRDRHDVYDRPSHVPFATRGARASLWLRVGWGSARSHAVAPAPAWTTPTDRP
jgi:hypothetical protein